MNSKLQCSVRVISPVHNLHIGVGYTIGKTKHPPGRDISLHNIGTTTVEEI